LEVRDHVVDLLEVMKFHLISGIPYAEPPLGELRLKPPVLKKRIDSETFDASNFGAACLQPVCNSIVLDHHHSESFKEYCHSSCVRRLFDYQCFSTCEPSGKHDTARCMFIVSSTHCHSFHFSYSGREFHLSISQMDIDHCL